MTSASNGMDAPVGSGYSLLAFLKELSREQSPGDRQEALAQTLLSFNASPKPFVARTMGKKRGFIFSGLAMSGS
jgi:hypothetical protein